MFHPMKAVVLTALVCFTGSGFADTETIPTNANSALAQAIAGRSDIDKTRDDARHPQQTLSFFKLEPGMTIAEALPGQGWYTAILAPYLGGNGALLGVNYVKEMWPLFGFMGEEQIKKRQAATKKFPRMVAKFTDNGIDARGFTFTTIPDDVRNTVDRVLIIRALHNLNRFEAQAGTRSQALSAVRFMLKSDGLVGVVQHRLPESADDAGADGARGYLKQSTVIEMFKQAGFELVDTSEINANPKDQPGPKDIVWRLPPSFNGSENNPESRAEMEAIGESDRMTLLFKKAS